MTPPTPPNTESAHTSSANAVPSISIVIPAYNELARLPDTLRQVLEFLKSFPETWELLIADDGSTDGSPEIIQREFPQVRVLVAEHNEGKGGAVRRGMLAARGELRLFSDADLSTPIEELLPMIAAIRSGGFDIAIASRALPESSLVVRQPKWREFSGRMFNRLVQPLSGLPIVDTQCGFKLFTASSTRIVFPRQRCLTWAFDVELLMLARANGLKIKECPVRWLNNSASKVNFMRDAPKMLGSIISFRWRALRGDMTRPAAADSSSQA